MEFAVQVVVSWMVAFEPIILQSGPLKTVRVVQDPLKFPVFRSEFKSQIPNTHMAK